MSIFVSRFSSGRFGGSNLQGLRINQDGVKGGASAAHRDRGIDHTQEGEKAQRVVRDREELLVSNQRATLLFENLRIFDDSILERPPRKGDTIAVNQDGIRKDGRVLSRLGEVSLSDLTNQAMLIVSRLQTVSGGGLDAEGISETNTTSEIRFNLQEDVREVGLGLLRDAGRQEELDVRKFVQNLAQIADNRTERKIQSNEVDLRELRIEEQSLERELFQIHRQIRNGKNENNRLEKQISRSTATTLVGLGSRVNILAF